MVQARTYAELANSESVRDLAKKVFGAQTEFVPEELYQMDSAGEPRMWIYPAKHWTEQQLKYFSSALDKDTKKYRVSYVLPDPDKGRNAIQVTFFKSFAPTR